MACADGDHHARGLEDVALFAGLVRPASGGRLRGDAVAGSGDGVRLAQAQGDTNDVRSIRLQHHRGFLAREHHLILRLSAAGTIARRAERQRAAQQREENLLRLADALVRHWLHGGGPLSSFRFPIVTAQRIVVIYNW